MGAYLLCFVLLGVGVYAILGYRNIVKIIIGMLIAENAVNLLFVLIAFRRGGDAPILSPGGAAPVMVDPLPHALVLTAIVIGLATTALMVALAMRIYDKYGTYDIAKIRELRG